MRKTQINYFDAGLFDGEEIAMMLEIAQELNMEIKVFGFEANPELAEQVKQRFAGHDNVSIFPVALSRTPGLGRLYLNPNRLGSSLYKDKNNVQKGKEWIPIQQHRLTDTLPVCIKDPWHFNILKMNIEGAELEVLKDLEERFLLEYFDLYLGDGSGEAGYCIDLYKIPSRTDLVNETTELMRRYGLSVLRFSSSSPHKNDDVKTTIETGLNANT